MEPATGRVLFRQLLVSRLSAVVLYRSAMEYSVSFARTVMATQPLGMVHETGWASARVAVGVEAAGSVGRAGGNVGEGSGEANSTAKVVGMGEGVDGSGGADDSARDNEMPPMTNKREMTPMMNPLPI